MKIATTPRLVVALFAFVVLLAGQSPAQAQDAQAVLARLKQTFETTDALRARFTYTQRAPGLAEDLQRTGTLTLRKNQYRVEFPEETFVSDGKTTWYYAKPDNEVVINDYIEEDNAFSPSTFFLTYPDQFNATLASTTPIGGVQHHVLKLTPKDSSSIFKTVTLWVRASDALVTRLEVEDHNGASHRFDLSNIERNPTLSTETFTFQTPAGADVTDLRM